MAEFKVSLGKGPSGEILVNGQYVSGNEPVFVERVNIEELNSNGDVVFVSSHHVNRSIDPSPGAYTLVSKLPSGSNIKAARASAYYVEIEEVATSSILQL